jgi:hypothetical protein
MGFLGTLSGLFEGLLLFDELAKAHDACDKGIAIASESGALMLQLGAFRSNGISFSLNAGQFFEQQPMFAASFLQFRANLSNL